MELLSKNHKDKKEDTTKVLFDSGYLKVLDINNYHVVQEHDMLICIPYLVEENSILLRYEDIPTYTYIRPEIDKFICVMSETFEKNESPKDVLFRGLKEEFGIILNDKFQPEILTPIFANKANTAQYHICILPIMQYDYEQIIPTTDGSEHEKKSSNIKVNINELNNYIIYDLITRYTIDIFKKHYSLF